MTNIQVHIELEKYKIKIIDFLKSKMPDIDESRVKRIIESNYPDYRTITQKLDYEFI